MTIKIAKNAPYEFFIRPDPDQFHFFRGGSDSGFYSRPATELIRKKTDRLPAMSGRRQDSAIVRASSSLAGDQNKFPQMTS